MNELIFDGDLPLLSLAIAMAILVFITCIIEIIEKVNKKSETLK